MFHWKILYLFSLDADDNLGSNIKKSKPRRIFSQKAEGEAQIKFNWEMKSKGDYFLEFSLDDQFESVLESRRSFITSLYLENRYHRSCMVAC